MPMSLGVGDGDDAWMSITIVASWPGIMVMSPSVAGSIIARTSPENRPRSGEISSKSILATSFLPR